MSFYLSLIDNRTQISPMRLSVTAACGVMALLSCAEDDLKGRITPPSECGNGIREAGEACDDGNSIDSDTCLHTCELAICGDGVIHEFVEECDDGNLEPDDACTDMCMNAFCGDGIIWTDEEQCDEGPDMNLGGDCALTCRFPGCRDGIRTADEQCDDGNDNTHDACTNDCLDAYCGDEIIWQDHETCDDGNLIPDDDCANNCQASECGDGIVHTSEECDDGNTDNSDACVELDGSCVHAFCGDGHVRVGEERCDDGNLEDDDGCVSDCQFPIPECIEPRAFNPIQRWDWAVSGELPLYDDANSALVTNLNDDNGDGRIDEADAPDIVIIAHYDGFSPESESCGDWVGTPTDIGRDLQHVGRIRVVDGATGEEWQDSGFPFVEVSAFSYPAVADIDNNGRPEIITRSYLCGAIDGWWTLLAIDADAQILWESEPFYQTDYWGFTGEEFGLDHQYTPAISIANLDGLGHPEIIVGSAVFDSSGHLIWQGTGGHGRSHSGSSSVIADIDPDTAGLEVLAGRTWYHADGAIYRELSAEGVEDGRTAVADCDGDTLPEVLLMPSDGGVATVLNSNGDVLFALPVSSNAALAAGDLDRDGDAEWVFGDGNEVIAMQCDGEILWQYEHTAPAKPAVFDFEGDGFHDVVVGGSEAGIVILGGLDGAVRYDASLIVPNPFEGDGVPDIGLAPIIADLDRDGHADILQVIERNCGSSGSPHCAGSSRPASMRMFNNIDLDWATTRSAWNQWSYHVSNINPDGSIPNEPVAHWLEDNVFRGNASICVAPTTR